MKGLIQINHFQGRDYINILFWHGYYLHGSGSNIFALNISRELSKQHRVFLFSQENNFEYIEGVKNFITLDERGDTKDERSFSSTGFTAVRPHIGELLPVFVYDDYEGFKVKITPDLTNEELERYIEHNVISLVSFIEKNNVDIIYANHFAIAPYIMKKVKEITGTSYIIIGHGSSLNYTVAKDERYMELSYEGFLDAESIVIQSEYIKKRCKEVYGKYKSFFDEPKIKIVPAGVNLEQFKTDFTKEQFNEIARRKVLSSKGTTSLVNKILFEKAQGETCIENLYELILDTEKNADYREFDRDLVEKIPEIGEDEKGICYVGKLIISKGVQLLIMSLPYIFRESPKTVVSIIGYGKFRYPLELLSNALISGNKNLVEMIIENGRYLENGHEKEPLELCKEFWEKLRENGKINEYMELASRIPKDKVVFTGKLDHDTLPYILQQNHMITIPSIFPESFGMVCAEGMALGLVPVTMNHSGLKEVIPFEDNLVDLDENVIESLTAKVNLNLKKLKEDMNLPLRFIEEGHKYSFEEVANNILKLYTP